MINNIVLAKKKKIVLIVIIYADLRVFKVINENIGVG